MASVYDLRREARGRQPAMGFAPYGWTWLAAVVAVLAISNVLNNGVLPAWAYVPWNVGVAGVVVLLARHAGLQWAGLGLDSDTWRRSAVVGSAAVAVVVVVYAIAVALPFTRDLFDDERVGTSAAGLVYRVALQVPLGTVLLEEIAFRGVLPGLLGWRDGSRWRWRPAAGASVLFALWHVLPAARTVSQNAAYGDVLGDLPVLASAAAVAAMFVAGLGLCWLRWLGRGLLAPIMVHVATNSLGFLLAWVVTHQ
jgi:membrane protease YdiL (CAAX protease family)